jgi:hypothetical protein
MSRRLKNESQEHDAGFARLTCCHYLSRLKEEFKNYGVEECVKDIGIKELNEQTGVITDELGTF